MTTAPYAGEAPNAHQIGHLKYYDGPPQDTVHPAPPDIQRPSSHTPAAQCADIVIDMRAVELLHETFAAHLSIVQDTTQAKLHDHYHGTDSTISATFHLGLPPHPLVGGSRDMNNAAQQPPAVQTAKESAAIAAGSQAWKPNADNQARAEFAEIEQASEDAYDEAQAFSAELDKSAHTRAESDLRMQQDREERLATRLHEQWEREKEINLALEQWNETVPCDVHTAENG